MSEFKRMNLLEIQDLAMELKDAQNTTLTLQLLSEIKAFRDALILHERSDNPYSPLKLDRSGVFKAALPSVHAAIAVNAVSKHPNIEPITTALSAIADLHNPNKVLVFSGEEP